MDFASRRTQLTERLRDEGLDAFLVTALPNIAYLTGFTGSNGLLVVSNSRPVLFTDPRYEVQAAEQTDCAVRICRNTLVSSAASLVRRKRWRRIGFEAARLPFSSYQALADSIGGVAWTPTMEWVEQVRAIKSAEELRLIERSVKLCSEAFTQAIRRVRPGLREYEVAAEIDHQMRLLGAEKPAFDTIVASGRRSALPHAQPTPRPLVNNQLLLIDMGAQLNGYMSDMTRMVYLGRQNRRAGKFHAAVLEAQLAALDAVRDGAAAAAVDGAARRVLKAHGLESLFVHSTGHGLGLEIHELPRIGKNAKTSLRTGMVITVEPGVYMDGFGGVRIEDTVLVTQSGSRVLTPTPKEPLVV